MKAVKVVFFFAVLFGALFPFHAGAVSLLQPFGGRVLSVVPIIVNPLCPANVGFVMAVGPFPSPIIASIPTFTPPFVKGGVALSGNWVLGLATPALPPCLPIVTIMGASFGL